MDARISLWTIVSAALLSLAADYKTPNFIVTAPTIEIAQRIGQAAERCRRDLAQEWLGQEMPEWSRPCLITVDVSGKPRGETTFEVAAGEVFGWKMSLGGPLDKILDSTLPHQVMRTVLASHFRKPVPLWADEGIGLTTQHSDQRTAHDERVAGVLRSGQTISLSALLSMKDRPSDTVTFFAESHSLVSFLLAKGSKQKVLSFLADGMSTNDWAGAARKHYGCGDLAVLQIMWVDWIRQQAASANPVGESPIPLDDKDARPTSPDSSGWGYIRSADSPGCFACPRPLPQAPRAFPNESYASSAENEFLSPLKERLSTFSIDVDTASYSNVRRFLENTELPPPDAVRIEEMINYFRYDYAPPKDNKPLAIHVEAATCPWNTKHRLVRIGLKARDVSSKNRPAGNLVFLIDVSGSMDDKNKLPLVKAGLAMLVESMTENDRVAIVTYSNEARLVLESTPGDKQSKIMQAISDLQAHGATNGAHGIQLAYQTAQQQFRREGINRVILCTDGDFNVGVTDDDELVKLIQDKARGGVFLSVFGFGMGNLQDAKLEELADRGNGHYGYIDSRGEARKAFVEDLTGTLVTVAKDVKIQIRFNPEHVAEYRLIGYENRALTDTDFNDDAKDAGDMGAGHTVTALYEIIPKHADSARSGNAPQGREALSLQIRYKSSDSDETRQLQLAWTDNRDGSVQASADFDWAVAVAAFGMLLRNSTHKGTASWVLVEELARGAKEKSGHGPRCECFELMRKAAALQLRRAEAWPAPR